MLGILIAGYTVSRFLLPYISDQSTLTRNQRRWAAAQPPHYRYIFEPVCFCPPEYTRPVIIEAAHNAAISIRYLDDGTAARPDIFDKYATIDKLFVLLQDALKQPGSRLRVTYDPQLGYPSKVAIDYLPNAVDDEFYFTVRNLEAIE